MSQSMDSISGYFVTIKEPYLVDYKNNQILFQGKPYLLKRRSNPNRDQYLFALKIFWRYIRTKQQIFGPHTVCIDGNQTGITIHAGEKA